MTRPYAKRTRPSGVVMPLKPAKLNAAQRDLQEQEAAWARSASHEPVLEGYCPQCRTRRLSQDDHGRCMFCAEAHQ